MIAAEEALKVEPDDVERALFDIGPEVIKEWKSRQ
jgi:hypothetical protein